MITKIKKTGFTLVELLVVVAIIGLLSGMVVISMKNVKAKARDSQRVSDMNSIATALNMYHNDFNAYPYPDGCTPDDPDQGCYITGSDPLSVALKDSSAITSVPTDPLNVDNYRYYYQGVDGEDFYLEYYLETTSFSNDSGRKCEEVGGYTKCYIVP